jgi:ABC-type polysaccharide/polyol phosphate export permease
MDNNEKYFSTYDPTEHRGLKSFLVRNSHDLIIYRYAIYNFISSNLRARYRRSAIGFLWSLLNPLFTMIIMSIVFSSIFHNPITNFSIYLFSGLLPWNLVSASMVAGSMSIVHGEAYLKKVYVPKLIFPLVIVGVEVVNFLLSLLSLFFLAVFLGAKISWALLTLPVALFLIALFLFGLVLILSIVTVYFRDLSHIIQIAMTGLFYLTPIIYPVELLSKNLPLITVIKLNPFFYFVGLFHSIIYDAKFPEPSIWLICLSLTVISLLLGLIVFNSREKDVIYRL